MSRLRQKAERGFKLIAYGVDQASAILRADVQPECRGEPPLVRIEREERGGFQ